MTTKTTRIGDHFLPVKELAVRPVDLEVLRQFGLVDNEEVDHFLAAAFGKRESGDEADNPGPALQQEKQAPNVAASDQPVQNN